MTYNTIKRSGTREECVIFEIDLDLNDPTYDAEFVLDPASYGTPKTTNDVRAYLEGSIRTYRYSSQRIVNLDCFGGLTSAATNPPKANPGIDIGFRATASINLDDFETSDAFELQPPYDDRRATGSHFAKLFARNFVKNRPARIRRGYLVDGVYDATNFQTEHYIVDEYQGPSLSGKVTFNLVDVLALTNGINAKAPESSNATLNDALPASFQGGLNSITVNLESGLTEAEIEAKFGANGATGYAALGDEYVSYTVTSATGVAPVTMDIVRGQFGTIASAHDINATVQYCIAYQDTNVIDIIDDLIRNYTDIDQTYIPAADWAALASGELSLFTLTNIIAKETEVKKMLNELIQIAGLTVYVDVVAREIVITATPNFDAPVIVFDSVEHLEVGTLDVKNDFNRLVTRQLVRWAPKDYSSTEESNYAKNIRVAAILEELPDRLGTRNDGKEIVSRWIPNTTNGNQIAAGIAQRTVARYSQLPGVFRGEVDSKYIGDLENGKRMWIGSVFQTIVPAKVKATASYQPVLLTCQCTSVSAGRKADKWKVEGVSYKANIPPNADYYINAGEYLDYVLANEFSFTEAREYIVIVSAGAVFGSTSNATPAFSQGVFPVGATLKLINQGQALGKGGNGGDGGTATVEGLDCVLIPPTAPQVGGPAMSFTTDATIDNSFGLIGGGGGGGIGQELTECSPNGNPAQGQGGGGGQGFNAGAGGAGNPAGNAGTRNNPGSGYRIGGVLGNEATADQAAGGAAIITNGNTITITAGNNAEQIRGTIV